MKKTFTILTFLWLFQPLWSQEKSLYYSKFITNESDKQWVYFKQDSKVKTEDFFKEFSNYLELSEKDNFVQFRENSSIGLNHTWYQQYHNNVKVVGAEYMLHSRSGYVETANGNAVANLNINTAPKLTTLQAIDALKRFMTHTLAKDDSNFVNAWTNSLRKDEHELQLNPELLLMYDTYTKQPSASDYKLCYKFAVIYTELVSSEFVFIDANTGALFKRQPMVQSCTIGTGQTKWNGVKNFNTTLSGNSYVLDEQCLNIHGDVHTKKYSSFGVGTEYTDSDNNWNNPTAVTSHWYGRQCLDYFYNTYNRKSFDNQGSDLIILNEANGASPYGNLDTGALIDPNTNIMYLGRGSNPNNIYDDYNTLDIIGHEFTHAVTKYTSGLTYQNESGALNESFSDIFATAIERYVYGSNSFNWTIGEDLANGALRSLEYPQNFGKHLDVSICPSCNGGCGQVVAGQPKTYFTDPYWYTGTCDYGGVHINSGVQNYWFYLLANGGSGTNANGYQYNVTGIGFAKAISIVFTELTAGYLGSTSDYNIAFTATKLIAGTTYGYTSTEYNAVVAAWCAVGISGPNGSGCSSTTTCATPSNTNQTNITQTSATLTWGSVASATNYTVQYRVSGTSTWTTATTANTSYPLSNLNCNTTYEWQVRANCSSGNSSYSSIKTFPTNTCGTSCTPPNYDDCVNAQLLTSNGACFNGTVACANGSYGANQCSGCTCTSPDDKDVYFKFTAAATSHTVTLSNYASNFDGVIELRTDCAFGTSNGCYDPTGTPTTVSNTWNNLISGQTYYIRVFEFNYTGTPPSSPTFTVCVTHSGGGGTTCSTPSVLPVTNLTQSTATLNWGSVSSAISYTLQVRQSGGSWQTFNTTSTSYSFTGFACNTTYQWQVSANCANGSSAFTAIQSFSTLGCGGGTTCSAPTGLTFSNVGQNSATLSWNSVTGVTYYIVRYRTGGNSWSATNTTSIPFTANNLSCNSVYEWQIEAVCPNGNYPTSGTNFTTSTCTNGCTNTFLERTVNAPTCASGLLTVYTSQWQNEYNRVNNVIGGESYVSAFSLGGWVTVRYGTYNGTLVAQGSTPLTWNANQGSGTYFIHYNTNSSCGQATNPGTSTLDIVCCTIPTQPGNITGSTSICSGTFQSYSINPVSGATNYTWTLPAGWSGSSSTNSISATPGSSGGTISVTANNSCGNSQPRTLVINVNQAPTQPGTITGATTVCSGVAQTYSISAISGATNYTWSFSGGGTISGTGTSINFTPASNGTLAVIANNTCGSSNPRTLAIAINQTPSVTVNPSTVTICSGGSGTTLTAISDAQNFTWSPATGLSAATGQTVTANPTNNTTYTVTATNGNCSATASSVVTISNQLSVSINPANPVICGNSSVSLTATTSTAYSWSGPNGFTDNAQTVLAANAGNYAVTVTNPGGCSGSATASISVTQNPSLIIDAGANQVIQSGNSVQLGGTPTASGGTPPYTYSWNPTTALSSSSVSNPSANPTSNTTYNLTVTDSKGCFATDNVSVITSIDCQTFLFDSLGISVPHDSATYSLNLTTGVGCPWTILEGCSWLSFNNTTGNGTSSLTFTVAENTFTSPRTCYVNIEGNILIITQGQAAPCLTPVSDFTASQQAIFAGNTVTFSDNSTNTPSQLEWTFNGGNPATSTAQNPTVTYSSGGLFNVTLKATNNCGNNTLTKPNFINVIGTVGIDNAVFENSISIYPNPNSGTFRIVAQTPTQKAVQLKLFSAIGQLVYSEQVLPLANKIEKDVSVGNIATGIYLLQITVNNKPSYKKLIIE